MRDDTRKWIALAEYDLVTAGHMFETGRYVYVIFMCHLALEKLLLSFAEVMSPKGRTRRNAGCAETTRIGCMTGSAASASDVWGAGL